MALAFLPWLHQKYSIVAAVLGLIAAVGIFRARKDRPGAALRLGLLFAPLVTSAFFTIVYTHALTGSVLPDATFRAVGRTSFAPGNMARGLLGLLFDAENGLFVYAPVYLLALVGTRKFSRNHPNLVRPVSFVLLSYLLVIASFPYWPGAVSSVARYILSVVPFAVFAISPVVRRSFSDGVLAGTSLAFFAAALAMTVSFQNDIVHSYQPALLLQRTLFSDPHQYLPSFLSEGWVGSGPAHVLKLAAIAAGLLLLMIRSGRRVLRGSAPKEKEARAYPWRLIMGGSGVIAFAVAAGALMERVPSNRTTKTGPQYRVVRPLRAGSDAEVGVEGRFGFERGGVWVPGGSSTKFLVSSPQPLSVLRLAVTNTPRQNQVLVSQRRARPLVLELGPSSREVMLLPLKRPYVFDGPSGHHYIYSLTMRSRAGFVPGRGGDGRDWRRLGCYVVLR
jgi:hypothetical protein